MAATKEARPDASHGGVAFARNDIPPGDPVARCPAAQRYGGKQVRYTLSRVARPALAALVLMSTTPAPAPAASGDAAARAGAGVFTDGFEAGLLPDGVLGVMVIPRFSDSSLVVLERSAVGWVASPPLNEPQIAGGASPNAVAFDSDNKVWVTDVATRTLLRFDLQDVITDASIAPEVQIGPLGDAGDPVGLAFHGGDLYVATQNFFSGNNRSRIYRYAASSLAGSGNPAPVSVFQAGLDAPAGLAFDPLGRLWVTNYGDHSVVRLDRDTGAVQLRLDNVAAGSRNAFNRPEGIALDQHGGIWVSNNGEFSLTALGNYRTMSTTSGTHPADVIKSVDHAPGNLASDTFGGIAFDHAGRMWNHNQSTGAMTLYDLTASLFTIGGVGTVITGYSATHVTNLNGLASYPGFGGLAIWPVPETIAR